ncbi:MAG TPA: tRNA pseudouridine(55) synthase TruB [Clostridiales bacterium]|nr:tRNA pseudouridine(55) synthase TruB [Clostridiales bacterium]
MNGVVNVLKPPAMSSGNAVAAVKRILGEKKVGHTGTLDPGAAGVLPVCVGRATKLASYIMNGKKEYIAEIVYGIETDTLDSYGKVTGTCGDIPNEQRLKQAMGQFTGAISQAPPAYSAIKHEGTPLYKLARKGLAVQKPPRDVTIYGIELLGRQEDRCLLKIQCSKGTYIRTLLADMAEAMGTCAYTSFLLRTKTGGFAIEDAVTLDELEEAKESALISMEEAISFLPKVQLPGYLYPVAVSGAAIDLSRVALQVEENTDYAVYCENELIAIARKQGRALKAAAMMKI